MPTSTSDNGAEAFFRDLRSAFERTLDDGSSASRTEIVTLQAWDSFAGNVAIQSEGPPPVACSKGCPSCCTLRVTALAPEVFMVAAYLRATAPALRQHGIDLIGRLREIDAATGLPGARLARQACLRRSCGRAR